MFSWSKYLQQYQANVSKSGMWATVCSRTDSIYYGPSLHCASFLRKRFSSPRWHLCSLRLTLHGPSVGSSCHDWGRDSGQCHTALTRYRNTNVWEFITHHDCWQHSSVQYSGSFPAFDAPFPIIMYQPYELSFSWWTEITVSSNA